MILILKACLIALACLLALATLAVAVILGIAYWIAKGEYSLGVDADSAGLCHCPDCVNHDGTGLDCHAPYDNRLRDLHSTCAARTSAISATPRDQLLTPNS